MLFSKNDKKHNLVADFVDSSTKSTIKSDYFSKKF